jgi:hypothetical protein
MEVLFSWIQRFSGWTISSRWSWRGKPKSWGALVAGHGGCELESIPSFSQSTNNTDQLMKIFKITSALAFAGALFLALPVKAGPQAKTYRVTGAVLELTDTMIVVQKGDEKWQVARDKGTKVNGDLKVGAKVTVQYRCVATDVEVKPAPAEKKSE